MIHRPKTALTRPRNDIFEIKRTNLWYFREKYFIMGFETRFAPAQQRNLLERKGSMKKLIALMMCAMLLLSGCTAVTAEGPGTGFQVRDLVITSADGDVLDLTGLNIGFELAEADTGVGCRTTISADGQESADIIWAAVGQYLYLSLPGTEGTHSYALDMNKVVQALTDAIDGISEEINGIIPAIFPGTGEGVDETPPSEDAIPEMTDEELEAAMAELEESMAGLEDGDYVLPDSGMSEEDAAAQQAMQEKINEILMRCMTQEVTQIDGEDFQVISFDIGPDDMTELLDATPDLFSFNMNGETVATLGQLLSAVNVSVALQGSVTGNQDFSKFLVDFTPVVTSEGKEVSFNVNIDSMAGDGTVAASLSTQQDGQSTGALSMLFAATVVEDGGWLPTELGEDTVVLTEMPLEQVEQVLADGFNDYLTVFQNIASGVAEANQAG